MWQSKNHLILSRVCHTTRSTIEPLLEAFVNRGSHFVGPPVFSRIWHQYVHPFASLLLYLQSTKFKSVVVLTGAVKNFEQCAYPACGGEGLLYVCVHIVI